MIEFCLNHSFNRKRRELFNPPIKKFANFSASAEVKQQLGKLVRFNLGYITRAKIRRIV